MIRRAAALFTIGYEKATPEGLVAALAAAGVTTVIDVRAVPASRRAGFSKTKLAERLAAGGIGYLHLRELGTPKAGREAARKGDTATMRRVFAAQMAKPEAQEALAQAIALAKDAPVCLLCLERNHDACHRAIVADAMAERGKFRVLPLLPETSR